MSAIFTVDNLGAHYLTRFGVKIQAVDGVDFELQKGDILGVAGESGCGKSTLVNACMGLYMAPLHHSYGSVALGDQSITDMSQDQIRRDILAKEIAIIPQGALNSLNPTRKIKDFASDVMQSHLGKVSKKEILERLRERFSLIGLDADRVLNAYPCEIPAGVKQRVVIGISTIMNPKVVIADEPTSALDVSTQKQVISLLFNLMDKEIISSMIFITHELPLLRHVANKIAIMYAGEFVEVGSTEQVIFNPIQPYTKALMGSMIEPEAGQKDRKPEAIEGAPPNLADETVGCRFADRCKMATPECETERQSLRTVHDRLVRCNYVG
ncbi:MAG: ABC transporter ATP-binding protein [Fibrobacterales bacterium]